ncbi:siderophore-interacting protein [Sphingomonas phyllosphaerae]|uniref:siderophore-interacting protein n=1 Tax=Sphingomonas phyllosphaerae TaxID=257003 RepID=UPI002FFA1FD7
MSRAVARMVARRATVVAIERLADGFIAITLEAPGFRGAAWTPGAKIQVAMGSVFDTRTYTPIGWDAERGRTRIIGFLQGPGPGCAWLRDARTGDTCDVLGPRHSLDLRRPQGRIAFFGDETSLGLAYAVSRDARCSCHLEAGNAAVIRHLFAEWGLHRVDVVARMPADVHLDAWITALPALVEDGATFVLTGRAQTIQRLKDGLKLLGVPSGRTMTKAYWAPGKSGFD